MRVASALVLLAAGLGPAAAHRLGPRGHPQDAPEIIGTVLVDGGGTVHQLDTNAQQERGTPEENRAEEARLLTFLATCNEEVEIETKTKRASVCSELRQRNPPLNSGINNRPSFEKSLSDADKEELEHTAAKALITAKLVTDTTAQFGRRLLAVVKAGAKYHGLDSEQAALMGAFGKACSIHTTGFPGIDATIMEEVLSNDGNVREVWALMYCLSKNQPWLDTVLEKAAEESAASESTGHKTVFQQLFGDAAGALAWATVKERKVLVDAAKTVTNFTEKFGLGTPDYLFPSMDSWVRFGFPSRLPDRLGKGVLWDAARVYKGECTEVTFMTNDAGIVPPLSEREKAAACEGAAQPCKLKWYPGKGCFSVPSNTIYYSRTEHNGYRRVASASGTTANALQLALTLGFSDADMVAFRATMFAWMVAHDDHSFIEVMLGAAHFIKDAQAQMQWGLNEGDSQFADFERIFPGTYVLHSSWGATYTYADTNDYLKAMADGVNQHGGGLLGTRESAVRAAAGPC